MKKTPLFPKVFAFFLALTLSVFHPSLFAGSKPLAPEPGLSPVITPIQETDAGAGKKTGSKKGKDSGLDSTDFLMDEGPIAPAGSQSNDPFFKTSGSWGQSYDDLWWLKAVEAPNAWGISKGAGVTVAVIDSGVDFNHEDLAGNFWSNSAEFSGLSGIDDDHNGYVDDIRGWDFYNGDNLPADDYGHGSHVAGIIAAQEDNGKGIAGIAPDSTLLPLKVLNSSGSGYIESIISAIQYATDMGAKIINMSFGALKSAFSKSLQNAFHDAIRYAYNKGVILVAAAGNGNTKVSNSLPAGFKEVIAVGALNPKTLSRASFSNIGGDLDFMAPGVDVLSLRAAGTSFGSSSGNPGYSRASGTSMSSPIVAGVVALMLSKDPGLSFGAIVKRLKASSLDLGKRGFDSSYGFGLINAYRALTQI